MTSTFIESLVFTGPLLGWSSLAFCLKNEGYFDTCSDVGSIDVSAEDELETTTLLSNSSCALENDSVCADQIKTINDLYTYAAIICNIYCLASGYLLDKVTAVLVTALDINPNRRRASFHVMSAAAESSLSSE